MKRRKLLKTLGALSIAAPFSVRSKPEHTDVVVIGAGVFGTWIAEHVTRSGKSVTLIDAVQPAHSSASSGGESRVIRAGYGKSKLYSEWAQQSLNEWQWLSQHAGLPLFQNSGVLWLHKDSDSYVDSSTEVLKDLGIPYQQFNAKQLRSRYPYMTIAADEYGFYEPNSGALLARQGVQYLANKLQRAGTRFVSARVKPISSQPYADSVLPYVETENGDRYYANQFVFACGPWLDKVCPDAMQHRLFVTRQEVFYFAQQPSMRNLPVWADLPFYGIPSLQGRGFKLADDTHGPIIDPSKIDRIPSAKALQKARAFLARRFPSMADNPVVESRVCQYENSAAGDFIIDQHPGLENVLVAGGGSGHGFKHGPAVGAYVSGLLHGSQKHLAQFSLGQAGTVQQRSVQ